MAWRSWARWRGRLQESTRSRGGGATSCNVSFADGECCPWGRSRSWQARRPLAPARTSRSAEEGAVTSSAPSRSSTRHVPQLVARHERGIGEPCSSSRSSTRSPADASRDSTATPLTFKTTSRTTFASMTSNRPEATLPPAGARRTKFVARPMSTKQTRRGLLLASLRRRRVRPSLAARSLARQLFTSGRRGCSPARPWPSCKRSRGPRP